MRGLYCKLNAAVLLENATPVHLSAQLKRAQRLPAKEM